MDDNIIPSDLRLLLYNSARYLQQLEVALSRIGVPARYDRPGVDDISMPRLCVVCSSYGEFGEVICTRTCQADEQWWFEWWRGSRMRICRAEDMDLAARLIAGQLKEDP